MKSFVNEFSFQLFYLLPHSALFGFKETYCNNMSVVWLGMHVDINLIPDKSRRELASCSEHVRFTHVLDIYHGIIIYETITWVYRESIKSNLKINVPIFVNFIWIIIISTKCNGVQWYNCCICNYSIYKLLMRAVYELILKTAEEKSRIVLML